MNTILKSVMGLDLLNCHAEFRGDMISRFRENLLFFGSFPDIPELKLSLPFWVMEGPDVMLLGCKSCRVTVLTVLVLFVSVKPEARSSFGYNLQVCVH